MKYRIPLICFLILVGCKQRTFPPSSLQTHPDNDLGSPSFSMGVSVVDISPQMAELASGQVYLGGYGLLTSRGPAKRIHDPIWARAVYLTDGTHQMLSLTMDLSGMDNVSYKKIVSQISLASKNLLSPDHILVSVTHSHSAPDLQGIYGGVSETYRQRVIDNAVKSAIQAYSKTRPINLSVYRTNGPTKNRRHDSFTDDGITILKASDPVSHQTVLTLVNFGVHPITIFSGDRSQVSSDFIHYTRLYLEQKTKAPAIFINGPLGDVVPPKIDSFAMAQSYGTMIGELAFKAIQEQPATPIDPVLQVQTLNFRHEIDNLKYILLSAFKVVNYDFDESTTFTRQIDTKLSYFTLGNQVQGVTVPGESVTSHAFAIKKEMTARFKLFLGLTHDSLGYLIPQAEWNQGHNWNYAESLSLHPQFADNITKALIPLIRADRARIISANPPAFLDVLAPAESLLRDKNLIVYLTFNKPETARHMTVNFFTPDQAINADWQPEILFRSATDTYTRVVPHEVEIPLPEEDSATSPTGVNPKPARGLRVFRYTFDRLSPQLPYFFRIIDRQIGGSRTYKFRTLPDQEPHQPLKFAVGGDSWVISEPERPLKMSRVVASHQPQVILFGGDYAYINGRLDSQEHWITWFRIWQATMSDIDGNLIPIIAAIGNHEVNGLSTADPIARAPLFMRFFVQNQNKTYFERKLGADTILFTLDSGNIYPIEGSQTTWLQQKLALQYETKKCKLALYHHPLFPGHRDPNGSLLEKNIPIARKTWQPVFDQYKFTVNFENHDHLLKRTYPIKGDQNVASGQGTVYLGDGCWGITPKQPFLDRSYLEHAEATQHVWIGTITAQGINMQAIGAENQVLDQVFIPCQPN